MSRPLGQSLPLDENVWVLSICMLPCRRSSHGDSSPSLRMFALGLRANKCRLMEPCCLGGSPFSFDQARGVLLFVLLLTLCRFLLSAALLDISFCFLIFLFSFASPCGGVLFCCWCHVTCFFSLVFSFLGFCARVLSALRPSLVRPFEFKCGFLRVCSSCCARAWFVFGVAGIQYALAIRVLF